MNNSFFVGSTLRTVKSVTHPGHMHRMVYGIVAVALAVLILNYFNLSLGDVFAASVPIADWRFDEGAGLTAADSSGNNQTGTLLNGTVWEPGKTGTAVSFDGINDSVSVLDNNILDRTGELALAAWIYPTDLSGTHIVLRKGYGLSNATNYALATTGDELHFAFYNGSLRSHISPNANLVLNTWQHVAAVYNDAANSVKLYVNGVEVLSVTQTASLLTNTATLNIGWASGTYPGFKGAIDDLRIYSNALTATEIQQIYIPPTPTPTPLTTPTPTPTPDPGLITKTYDISSCLGGLWSYRTWGMEDRWAVIPDENASYWTTKIPFLGDQPDAYFQMRGPVFSARYYSFNTYDPNKKNVDSLADDQIVTSAGEYIVKIRDIAPGQQTPMPNVIRSSFSTLGTEVILRLYLPTGDPTSWILPRIEYVVTGTPAGLPQDGTAACAKFNSTYIKSIQKKSSSLLTKIASWTSEANTITTRARQKNPCYVPIAPGTYQVIQETGLIVPWSCNQPWFYNGYALGSGAGYQNLDNRYLWADLDYFSLAGPLTVFRFRRPPMPDLRYLSFCVQQGEHTRAWVQKCIADFELKDDPGFPGWVTLVMSAGMPPANISQYNWLPYQTDVPLLIVRYLRPTQNFLQAPNFWNPANGTLAAHMGEYYPAWKNCTVAEFEQGNRCGL